MRLEHRLCSARTTRRSGCNRAFIFCPRPLDGAFYDALPSDEKFLAVARRVSGSPAIPLKEGLSSPGGNNLKPIGTGQRWLCPMQTYRSPQVPCSVACWLGLAWARARADGMSSPPALPIVARYGQAFEKPSVGSSAAKPLIQ